MENEILHLATKAVEFTPQRERKKCFTKNIRWLVVLGSAESTIYNDEA
jgi:hypothetical protein